MSILILHKYLLVAFTRTCVASAPYNETFLRQVASHWAVLLFYIMAAFWYNQLYYTSSILPADYGSVVLASQQWFYWKEDLWLISDFSVLRLQPCAPLVTLWLAQMSRPRRCWMLEPSPCWETFCGTPRTTFRKKLPGPCPTSLPERTPRSRRWSTPAWSRVWWTFSEGYVEGCVGL